jgi:hypothetical protein
MSKESMIRISLWGLLLAAFGLFGTLLFIVHNEAQAAGKCAIEIERTMVNEYVREKDLDKRLANMEKTQDEMKADIKTLIKMHLHDQGK